MKTTKAFFRLLYIQYVLARHGLERLVVEMHLFAPFRFIIYFNPWNWFRKKTLSRGEALRLSLEQLGPLFIKFGQALATRPDILPDDIMLELCKLHDQVPPFASAEALSIIEMTYGQSAWEVFANFDPIPLASASIAQVHAATLKTGQDVIVKILRPGIRKVIEKDLEILKKIAQLLERYWKDSDRFKPCEVVLEFERNLYDELNLQREAANASQLRRNFLGSPMLYVPEIHWDYVRENVLVMERIYGIPIAQTERLKAHGVNMKKLAENGLQIFFKQVFHDCFFHADMHPGNIFVSYEHPEYPKYICVDFGIVGTLSTTDQRYLAENLLAFFNRDYRRVAELHIESGWVNRNSSIESFESAIRMVCEPIFEKPLKDISFAFLILQLFQVARQFNMAVQPQLVLLQKTLLAVEGLGRQLYPGLDIWATGKPFLEKWVRERISPRALLNNIRKNIPFVVEQLPHMPRLVYDVLVHLKTQQIRETENKVSARGLDKRTRLGFKGGLSLGILLAMSAVAGLLYFKLFTAHDFTVFAVTAATVGALTLILTMRRS
jgi:ubiquinone biosynthesis protein